MPKRSWVPIGAVLALLACANDYEQFDFRGVPRPDASAQGGSSGTSQGSGGQAGLDGSRPDAAGSGGSAGSATDAQAGTSGSAGTGGTTGGTSGSGGSAGTGGTAGTAGSGGTGGVCDPTERATCGGCENNCEEQGLGSGFQCINEVCGCTGPSQCGQGPNARCGMMSSRCYCNDNQCASGETCSFGGNCSCNGGPSCDDGEICCQNPPGCRTSCE
jgi:hypothetical protein